MAKGNSKKNRSSTAIQKAEVGGYLVLQQDSARMKEIVKANIGEGAAITPFELQRIKVPAGGGLAWNVPSLEGTKSEKELVGIIAGWQEVRGYWPGAYSGATPPQCSSADCIHGVGDPGGECKTCSLAEFRSAIGPDGEPAAGQACKQMRRLFIIREGEFMPHLLVLPPTSLKACRKYFVELASRQHFFWEVITAIGLETAANLQGINYSVATFRIVAPLEREAAAKMRAYTASIEAFKGAPIDYYQEDENKLDYDVDDLEGVAGAEPAS